MKKNEKKSSLSTLWNGIIAEFWFSLIELIIVISIIAIISVFWMSSFSNKIDSLKFKNILWEISGDLKDLDNKINSKQIFDYEVILEKNQKYYLFNENIFDLDISLKLDSLDENSWIWNISFSWVNSWSWLIKYYSDSYKFQKQEILDYNKIFTWSFNSSQNYKIIWIYSWSILNNLYINYFDKDKYLQLVNINTNISTDLNKINIKNILWKKEFWNNSSINKIVLTFEDDLGKSEVLEIKK